MPFLELETRVGTGTLADRHCIEAPRLPKKLSSHDQFDDPREVRYASRSHIIDTARNSQHKRCVVAAPQENSHLFKRTALQINHRLELLGSRGCVVKLPELIVYDGSVFLIALNLA